MAKLMLGTQEVSPTFYSEGYKELPSYQVSNGVLSKRSGALTGDEFSGITSIDTGGLCYAFYGCTQLSGTVNLSSLISIDTKGISYAFQDCTHITGINLSSLTTAGAQSFEMAFSNCIGITSIRFNSLTNIGYTSVLLAAFYQCYNLTDIYFPALTTNSFGSYVNQFRNMMSNTGSNKTHTIHFPSNLETTIQGLTGYPNFGGTSGYVVLAFDLPETS